MKFYNSLKFKLPFFVLLGIIPGVVLTTFIAGSTAQNSMRNKTEDIIELKTRLIREKIEKWDRMNVGILVSLSTQPGIISMKAEQQEPYLLNTAKTYSHIYRAMTINAKGYNVARNDSSNLKYLGDREYFSAALSGEDVAYQSIKGRTSKRLAVCMGTRIVDAKVEVRGVTAICTYLGQITKEIGQLSFGDSGYAMLIDSEGIVLAHPDPAFQVSDSLQVRKNFPPVKNLLANGNSNFAFSHEGKEWISRSTRLNNGWGVVVVMSKAEFLADERRFSEIMLTVGVLSVIGLGLFILILANQLINPISNLTIAAKAIASGRYNFKLKSKRQDELGILANLFDLMGSKVRSRQENLEAKVKERTKSLEKENERTQKALARARAAERARDHFLLKISHELKTPLNAIIGYSKQIIASPNADSRVKTINRSGEHLLLLINDICDFNKSKNSEIILDCKTRNLKEVCTAAIAIIEGKLARENLPLVNLNYDESIPPYLKVDSGRLMQVLINLLGNAVKFTSAAGAVNLIVTQEKNDGTNSTLLFKVTDTGIGIPREHLANIFQPYFKLSNQKSLEGMGLGLSISQQIINAMDSFIQVSSEVNKGSTFSFELILPLADKPEQPKRVSGYVGKTKKILIVEDIKENRELLKLILVPIGFEIIEAENGEKGLKIAKLYDDIDLIITDVLMPDRCGFTMIYQLRQEKEYKDTPIIANSSSMSIDLMEKQAFNQGANVFLSKPLDRDKLLKQIQNLLNLEFVYSVRSEITTSN